MKTIWELVQLIFLILYLIIITPLAMLELMILFFIGYKFMHLSIDECKTFSYDNSLFYKLMNLVDDSQ